VDLSCSGISRNQGVFGVKGVAAGEGAVMVSGLKHGKSAAGDDAAKERPYALVQEFITAFRAKNGSINCTELHGYDLRDPGQRTQVHALQAVATRCPGFTRDTVEILEKIL